MANARPKQREGGQSVGWVAGMLAVVVLYFGWGFLAADYFQNDPTDKAREANFWVNSVAQLPNLPRVLSYAISNRPGILMLIGGVEVAVVILFVVMKKVERDLAR